MYKHFVRTQMMGEIEVVIDGYADWQSERRSPDEKQLDGEFGGQFPYVLTTPPPRFQYRYQLLNGQMVERTQEELDTEFNTVAKRRQDVLNKWDPQIDAQRETLRKLQDEDKPVAAITKAKTNLHNLVASKNTELTGVQ
jgi:hypothetical protein